MLLPFLYLGTSHAQKSGAPTVLEVGCNPTVSEGFAIVHAIRSPSLDVIGLTTCVHDSPDEAKPLAFLLEHLGRTDIPIGFTIASWVDQDLKPDIWISDGSNFSNEPVSATELIIAKSLKYEGGLRLLATGPLTNMGRALKADPELGGRLREVVLPPCDLQGGPNRPLQIDSEATQTVFDSSAPIVLIDQSDKELLRFSRGRLVRLARARSGITDALTRAAALSRDGPPGRQSQILLTDLLQVAYSAVPNSMTRTSELVTCSPAGAIDRGHDSQGRPVTLCTGIKPIRIFQRAIDDITNPNLDFSVHFSSFIMNIPRFDEAARKKFQEGLKGISEPPPPPEGMSGRDGFQQQLLTYITSFETILRDIGDPAAEKAHSELESAWRSVAGIGWWFPDGFYERWYLDVIPGKRVHGEFGVADSRQVPLSNLSGSLSMGDERDSKSIDSVTDDAVFSFDSILFEHDWVEHEQEAQLRISFDTEGGTTNKTYRVPTRIKPAVEIAAVRSATDQIEVRLTHNWMNLENMALAVVARRGGQTHRHVVSHQIFEASSAWIPVRLEGDLPKEGEVIAIQLDPGFGKVGSLPPRNALIPSPKAVFNMEPEGPSQSACFATSREGKGGWTTDFLQGATSIEYAVSASALPREATGAIRLQIEYYAEGDELDSFRVEAAQDDGVYKPVTGWLRKPVEVGWRTDTIRLSPTVEGWARNGEVRWLKVRAGDDGDEIVRSLQFVPDLQ